MGDLLDKFERDGLRITVTELGPKALVTWEGISDTRDPASVIGPFIATLVRRLKGRSVLVDFRKFQYMNSSTVGVILRFIKLLDANQIPTSLKYDRKVEWQRVSFNCMRTIARTLSHIDVMGE